MIHLLNRNQIISHSINKSERHPALSEIAKFISLSIYLVFTEKFFFFILYFFEIYGNRVTVFRTKRQRIVSNRIPGSIKL